MGRTGSCLHLQCTEFFISMFHFRSVAVISLGVGLVALYLSYSRNFIFWSDSHVEDASWLFVWTSSFHTVIQKIFAHQTGVDIASSTSSLTTPAPTDQGLVPSSSKSQQHDSFPEDRPDVAEFDVHRWSTCRAFCKSRPPDFDGGSSPRAPLAVPKTLVDWIQQKYFEKLVSVREFGALEARADEMHSSLFPGLVVKVMPAKTLRKRVAAMTAMGAFLDFCQLERLVLPQWTTVDIAGGVEAEGKGAGGRGEGGGSGRVVKTVLVEEKLSDSGGKKLLAQEESIWFSFGSTSDGRAGGGNGGRGRGGSSPGIVEIGSEDLFRPAVEELAFLITQTGYSDPKYYHNPILRTGHPSSSLRIGLLDVVDVDERFLQRWDPTTSTPLDKNTLSFLPDATKGVDAFLRLLPPEYFDPTSRGGVQRLVLILSIFLEPI